MSPHSDPCPDHSRQKGFALIIVVWIGILLALIAAAFSSSVRSRLRSAAGTAETLQSEALADAGVRIVLLELLNQKSAPTNGSRFSPGGTALFCTPGHDATLILQLEDEEGKVNLNSENEDLLTALFSGLGAKHDSAREYAEKILDFRDNNSDKRPDGAELDDYKKGSPTTLGPKNANFDSVDELDQVLGIPQDIREKAKPFLSVLSSKEGIDPAVASPALKDVLVRGAGGIVATPLGGASSVSGIQISSDLPAAFVASSTHRAYQIRAEAVLPSGARYVSEAVIGLPSSGATSPILQHWRRGSSNLPAAIVVPSAKSLPPC